MVTTFGYVAIAMGALAGLIALALLVRYLPLLRAQRWSDLALWGMLSVFAAAALLVAGGSYRLRGYFRDQSRQEEAANRQSLFVEDPVQSFLLRFEVANPFHERPEDCLLRLEVQLAPDRAFVSELAPSQLQLLSGNPEEPARIIEWTAFLDGIADAKGKEEAQKLANIGDWRLVAKLHTEIVDRRTRGEKLPIYMSLRFNGHEPELFSAPAAAPAKRADNWVVVFRDANTPKQRLDAPFRAAFRPADTSLGRSLTLAFAGGAVLLAGAGVLLFVGRRKASAAPALAPLAQNAVVGLKAVSETRQAPPTALPTESTAQTNSSTATAPMPRVEVSPPSAEGPQPVDETVPATSTAPSRTQTRLSRSLTIGGCAVIVLFAYWLGADQEVVAFYYPHDHYWFLRMARCWYWFDSEPFSQMTFIKEPVYPLFVAVCYQLGLNLRLAHLTLYLAGAGFFSWSLVSRQSRPWVGLLVFAACAVHPMSHQMMNQLIYDAIYSSVLLATIGALVLQLKRRGEPGEWKRGLLSGVLLGVLWNTRPERPLIVVFLLFFMLVSAVGAWWRGPTRKAALRSWIGEWTPAVGTLALLALAVMTANYARWGIFATTAQDAPGLNAAYRALLSVRQEKPLRRIPVTREARLLAAAASPTFRELEEHLQGDVGKSWEREGRDIFRNAPQGEIIGGWFSWALRDAGFVVGAFESGPTSEAFYYRIAEELRAAAADGELPTRSVLPFALDPHLDHYRELPRSWGKLWKLCWRREKTGNLNDDPADGPHIAEFNAVAHRRALSRQPQPQEKVRLTIATAYSRGMEIALPASLIVALIVLVVLVVRRRTPGVGAYFLAGAACAVVGLSRLGMFTVIDAVLWGGFDLRYIFPAALALSAMAVWLLAEGARLLLAPALPFLGRLLSGAFGPAPLPS